MWQRWALLAVADIRLDDQTVVACADVKLPAHRANLFIPNITGGSIPILNYAHTLCKFLHREQAGRAPRQFSMPSIAVSQAAAIKRDTSQCPPPSQCWFDNEKYLMFCGLLCALLNVDFWEEILNAKNICHGNWVSNISTVFYQMQIRAWVGGVSLSSVDQWWQWAWRRHN